MRIRVSFLVIVAVISLLISACSDSGKKSSSSGTSYKVGIVAFSSGEPTSQKAIAAYTKAAKAKGWDVTTVDPDGSTDKAVAAMQDLVQKKVDLLLVTVFDSTSLTAGLIAAKAANIPVASLSGGLADGIQINYVNGAPQGKLLAKELVKQTGGKGELLILGYSSGLPCIGREKSLNEALKSTSIKNTRNEVPIPGQVEASTKFTQAFLAKNPDNGDGVAVWGCYDDPALGAIAAVKQSGRTGIKVFGFDATVGGLKAVQDGEMTATVYADVTAAGQDLAKRTPDIIKAGVSAKGQDIPIPSTVVTQDNIKQFLADHPDALEGK